MSWDGFLVGVFFASSIIGLVVAGARYVRNILSKRYEAYQIDVFDLQETIGDLEKERDEAIAELNNCVKSNATLRTRNKIAFANEIKMKKEIESLRMGNDRWRVRPSHDTFSGEGETWQKAFYRVEQELEDTKRDRDRLACELAQFQSMPEFSGVHR